MLLNNSAIKQLYEVLQEVERLRMYIDTLPQYPISSEVFTDNDIDPSMWENINHVLTNMRQANIPEDKIILMRTSIINHLKEKSGKK